MEQGEQRERIVMEGSKSVCVCVGNNDGGIREREKDRGRMHGFK